MSNLGRWGNWQFEIARTLSEVRQKIAKHARGVVLQFRYVDAADVERTAFQECVPLVSLRAVASGWGDKQIPLSDMAESTSLDDWVTWDDHPPFEKGMFVARISGRSMEPVIADGAYGLFRPLGTRDPVNRNVLVWAEDLEDSEHGGNYTLKRYTTTEAQALQEGRAEWQLVLKPANPDFEDVVLGGDAGRRARVIAELVCELPPPGGSAP